MAEASSVHGWLELICGSMFSGKTEELIRRGKRAKFARQEVQAFTHKIDVRYTEGVGGVRIRSHDGGDFDAIPVSSADQILELVKPDTRVVLIDEGQFFDLGLVHACKKLVDSGKRVIVAGLDTNFRGEPFGPIPALMAEAEKVDKLRAICVVCGQEASRTQRIIDGRPANYEDPTILVGATEAYEARCRSHHNVPKDKNQLKLWEE